jgi:hypothetical protein
MSPKYAFIGFIHPCSIDAGQIATAAAAAAPPPATKRNLDVGSGLKKNVTALRGHKIITGCWD